MAGVVIQYKNLLTGYLVGKTTKVCTQLLADLKKPEVLVQLQALGLIGKLISGPWMKLIYKNAMRRSNLAFVSEFQYAMKEIERLKSNPEGVLTTNFDVFGQHLEVDRTLEALRLEQNSTLFNEVMKALLTSTESVLVRQLERYLVGDLSNPTSEMLDATSSAPPHNIFSERCLGIADYLIRRSPNVSVGFMDSKLKASVNGTLKWLDQKSVPEQMKLVTFAMHRGAQIRKACILLQQQIDRDILSRMKDLKEKQEKLERKKLQTAVRKAMCDKNVSVEEPIFAAVDRKQRQFLSKILAGEDLVGVQLTHKWELDDQGVSQYNGRIIERVPAPKKKSAVYTISYWSEDEDDAEYFSHLAESLVVDLLYRNLEFLSEY
ncbi:uncharacterized protein LOC131956245 isoform X3 [Physella acuta]|uniref:uncharacterized protein LOC131956245 isoform X3 n=1 Tax=Physella acuta TaxID=109671 RepID=UPI0027DC1E67|nr:uncharacterized protein LOC131956245 isoform X3 [Physella acuta]